MLRLKPRLTPRLTPRSRPRATPWPQRLGHLSRLALAPLASLSLLACIDDAPRPRAESELIDAPDAEVMATDALSQPLPIDASPPPQPMPDMTVTVEVDAEAPACAEDRDCALGRCDGGVCVSECATLSDCGRFEVCQQGLCLNRCLGPGTCFNGGVCVNGACLPEECEADADCPDGRLCRRQLCVLPEPCAGDDACGSGERCVAGNCEPVPQCGGDANCAEGEICTNGRCEARAACEDSFGCPEGEDCVAGRCVPGLCRGALDCAAGEVCEGGECVTPPDSGVARVLILNTPRALVVGQRLSLRAVGLDEAGQIIATQGFEWSSEPAGVGSVAQSGLFVAGPGAGEAAVRAAWRPGDGGEAVVSAPLLLPVLEPPPPVESGWRVRVADGASGAPLAGAQLYAGGAVYVTDAAGVVSFDVPNATKLTVTVMAEGFDTTTVVGVTSRALYLPLSPLSDDSVVAGFTGEIDFSRVPQGQVSLGLAGASFGDGVSNISLLDLIGQLFFTEVNAGPINATLPLPGGLVLSASVPFLGDFAIKDTYRVVAQPGFQLGWSFGGRIALTTILSMLEGQRLSVGRVLSTLLPFFDQFSHGVQVIPELAGVPLVPDVDDDDADGDRRELVPDYAAFPRVDLAPSQAQGLRLAVEMPPPVEGEGDPVSLILSGVDVVDVGFVPLGLSTSQEGGLTPMRMAPPYGGLQVGEYLVLALSARFNNRIPRDLSGLISRFGQLPEDVSLVGSFMDIPDVAAWEPAYRRVTPALPEGADLLRVSFRGGVGRWVVYFGAEALDPARLPYPASDSTPDLTVGLDVRFDAIDLEPGVTLDDLVGEGGAGDLLQLDRFTQRFSRRVDNGR